MFRVGSFQKMLLQDSESLIILICLCICLGLVIPLPLKADSVPPLFLENNLSYSEQLPFAVEKANYVKINFAALKSNRIKLNISKDKFFIAHRKRTENRSSSQFSWIGEFPDDPYGYIILIVNNDMVTGNFVFNRTMYQIRPKQNGIHAVYVIRQSDFPNESEPVPVNSSGGGYSSALTDDGSLIDVMVVYTDDVASVVVDIDSLILLAIEETNVSYENSYITQQVRLVHSAEVTYKESGDPCKDRERLQDPSDGNMDEVHAWRDLYCADLVTLWVEDGGGSACG